MSRLSRIVLPDTPPHVTRRGNRAQALFTSPGDHQLYRDLPAGGLQVPGIAYLGYCLLPHQIHLRNRTNLQAARSL